MPSCHKARLGWGPSEVVTGHKGKNFCNITVTLTSEFRPSGLIYDLIW